ncbi:MAG: tRNA glutamyl-Q(34) synthetase GluQRS [Rhizobiaceae bacterium]
MATTTTPVFRFAPSPNGLLHLGHAYSALVNQQLCDRMGGAYLLRLEDIDQSRCTPELEWQMLEDLKWLGIGWQGEPRRQSQHFDDYQRALDRLRSDGLIYPSFMSRGEIRRSVAEKSGSGTPWPRDPDGSPHYPGDERNWSVDQQEAMIAERPKHAWRLDTTAALQRVTNSLSWQEFQADDPSVCKIIQARPDLWGDVVLARSDTPTSYHLAVTVDDALQNVSHVVRGRDLYHATSVHRLLQELLDLPEPQYHHHDLVVESGGGDGDGDDGDGRKLSKSDGDVSLKALRERGLAAEDLPSLFRFSS